MLLKKINVLLICFIIAVIPCIYSIDFSYATAHEDDPWEQVQDPDMLVTIINMYLQSRGYKTISSPAGALNTWCYSEFERALANKGWTVSELNQHLKYKYDNIKPHFLIEKSALRILNDLYDALMTLNGITPNSTKRIYSGKYFTDADGNTCMCFVNHYDNSKTFEDNRLLFNDRWYYGAMYVHDGSYFNNVSSVTYKTSVNSGQTFNVSSVTGSWAVNTRSRVINTTCPVYVENGYISGYDTIIYANGQYSLGTFLDFNRYNSNGSLDQRRIILKYLYTYTYQDTYQKGDGTVDVNHGPATNPYEDDNKDYEITPPDEGDEPVVEPIPTNDPNTGGGTTNNEGDTTFNFFIVPNLPDLNPDPQNIPNKWKIPNLQQKFPFCIPFDLIAIYSVLDTEPQAPRIQQTVDFGGFTYNLDINLNTYDSAMVNIRKFILVLYIFGLLFITPSILKT